MAAMDLVRLGFNNHQFDLIICNHVLEHIRADGAAMREIRRALLPEGLALLQVPLSRVLSRTYEDFSLRTSEQRKAAFGQRDHVRIYGADFSNRLEHAGLSVRQARVTDEFDEKSIETYALVASDSLYVVRRRH